MPLRLHAIGWADRIVRAPASRAGSQSHEIRLDSLLESYSCRGRVAQLGEHLLCKQGVAGSIPVTSTNHLSISQSLTCKYKGVDFLEFVQSRERNVDSFAKESKL